MYLLYVIYNLLANRPPPAAFCSPFGGGRYKSCRIHKNALGQTHIKDRRTCGTDAHVGQTHMWDRRTCGTDAHRSVWKTFMLKLFCFCTNCFQNSFEVINGQTKNFQHKFIFKRPMWVCPRCVSVPYVCLSVCLSHTYIPPAPEGRGKGRRRRSMCECLKNLEKKNITIN